MDIDEVRDWFSAGLSAQDILSVMSPAETTVMPRIRALDAATDWPWTINATEVDHNVWEMVESDRPLWMLIKDDINMKDAQVHNMQSKFKNMQVGAVVFKAHR